MYLQTVECNIDYGVMTWKDGDIDIVPEHLYANSAPT